MVLFNSLLSLWDIFYSSFIDVYSFMSRGLSDIFSTGNQTVDNILNAFLSNVRIGDITAADLSLLQLMLGVGIPIIIVYSIAKWIVDIVL